MTTSVRLEWLEKHQRMAAFVACLILFMVLHQLEDVRWFRWDAGDYWRLSALPSLLNFPVDKRGYFYPLLLAPSRYAFDLHPEWGYIPYRIFSSIVYAYIFASLLPDFYRLVFGGEITFLRRLVVPVLTSIIYPGLIVYPLSDLPAICLLVGAVFCGIRSVVHAGRPVSRYALLVSCGVLAYGSYNTRTLYLFPVALLAIAVPFVIYHGYGLKTRSAAALVFLVGIFIAGLPQVLINVNHDRGWTPAVITSEKGESLFDKQLLWGIVVQRYETTLDRSAKNPSVVYYDEAGEQLVHSLQIGPDFSVGDYLKILVTHPLSFAGIYARHVVNGLDVRDGGAYSEVQSPKRKDFAIFNFLVVFLGLSIMVTGLFRCPPTNEENVVRLFWAFLLLLPVFMVIPGAIETRFFLPLHLAIYGAIAFSGDVPRLTGALRRYWLPIAFVFGLSALVFFRVSMDAMTHFEYGSQHVRSTFDATSGG